MNGKILPGDVHEHTHSALGNLFHGFIHPSVRPRPAVDQGLVDSAPARAAVALAAGALVVAALVEFVLAGFTGSMALVADGVNALAGAATAIPVFVAASTTTQATSTMFPYGRERAEDLTAILAVVAVALIAAGVGILSLVRLAVLGGGSGPWLIAIGGLVGIVGHQTAAYLRLAAGKSSRSLALSADGRAAMWSGLTGAVVVIGALGVAAGWTWLDSLAGAVIAVIVLRNLWRATQPMTTRLIDGIEEDLTWRIARAAEEAGAMNISAVRARWTGHRLHAEITVGVDGATPLAATRPLAGKVRAAVAAEFPELKRVAVLFVPVDAPAATNA